MTIDKDDFKDHVAPLNGAYHITEIYQITDQRKPYWLSVLFFLFPFFFMKWCSIEILEK